MTHHAKSKEPYSTLILGVLNGAYPEWVSALTLVDVGGLSFTRRISELRKNGHHIENKKEMIGGTWNSHYRLVRP